MAQSQDTAKMGPPPPYFQEPGMDQPQPPPAGFYPPPPGTTTPTVIPSQAHIVVVTPITSHYPMRLQCPHCGADVNTEIDSESGLMTHLIAFGLCIVGCIPCCLIPYCVDEIKDTTHKCPACHRHIAHVKRM